MTRCLPALLALCACGDIRGGTAVGNPGLLDASFYEAPGAESDLVTATFYVERVHLESCGREPGPVTVELQKTFDLLAPTPVELPGGDWCRMDVTTGTGANVEVGRRVDGEVVYTQSHVASFGVEGDLAIDGDEVILRVGVQGNRLESDAAGEDSKPPQPAPSEADTFDLGVIAVAFDGEPVPAAAGCSSAPASAAWLALFGLLGLRRRQER